MIDHWLQEVPEVTGSFTMFSKPAMSDLTNYIGSGILDIRFSHPKMLIHCTWERTGFDYFSTPKVYVTLLKLLNCLLEIVKKGYGHSSFHIPVVPFVPLVELHHCQQLWDTYL